MRLPSILSYGILTMAECRHSPSLSTINPFLTAIYGVTMYGLAPTIEISIGL